MDGLTFRGSGHHRGALLSSGTGSPTFIWVFLFIGLAATAYSYRNSDKPVSRAMRAVPPPNPRREEPPTMNKKVAAALTAAALIGGTTACTSAEEAPAPEITVEVVAPEGATAEAPVPTQEPTQEPVQTTGPFAMPYSLNQKINSYTAEGFWVARGAAIQDAETAYYYLVVETEGPNAAGRDVALWATDSLDGATARIWAVSPMAQEVTPGLPTPFDDGVSLYHYDGEVLIATQYVRAQH